MQSQGVAVVLCCPVPPSAAHRPPQAFSKVPSHPGWELPGVEHYLWSWKDRESWKHSHYEEAMALGFWQRKAEKAGRAGAGGSKAGAKPAL